MTKGFGFFGGMVNGMESADRAMLVNKQARAADLAATRAEGEIKDAQKVRDNNAAAEGALASAMAPGPAEILPDGTERPAAPRKLHDAYEQVANNAFRRGDAATGQKFLEASAAQKTTYYTQSFNDSWRKQDLKGMLGILNDFPNGQKYTAQFDPASGKIMAAAADAEGKPIGSAMSFDDINKLGEFVQTRMNPGDIYKRNIEDAKLRLEASHKEAQTGLVKAQTEGQQTVNSLEKTYGPQERTAKLGLVGAQTSSASASAGLAGAQARVVGQTPEMRNFGFRMGLPAEQQGQFDATTRGATGTVQDPSVVAAQKALLEAYADPSRQASLSAEEKDLAKSLLMRATEPSLLSKRTGFGFNSPKSGQPPSMLSTVTTQDDYARIPKGGKYKDPQGNVRTKQ